MATPAVLQTSNQDRTHCTASSLDYTSSSSTQLPGDSRGTHIDVAVEHGLEVIRNYLGYLVNQAHQEAAYSVVSRHFSRLSTKQRPNETLPGTVMSPADHAGMLPSRAFSLHFSPAHPQHTAIQCLEHPGCELRPLPLAVNHLRVQSPGWG